MLLRLCTLMLVILALNGCVATAIIGGSAPAPASASEQRPVVSAQPDDDALAMRIETRLIAEKGMHARWINVEVSDGAATLTGYLPSQNQIERAVAICRRTGGITSVDSQIIIGRPRFSDFISDSWITAQVRTALLKDPVVSGLGIHVETVDGMVYLQGIIKQPDQRRRAIRLTRTVDGVTGVVDRLRSE